jgi:hypothetical protein
MEAENQGMRGCHCAANREKESCMTETAPDGPYIYQPFGPVSHPEREQSGRFFGIGAVDLTATITGLTKREADCILSALRGLK